MLIYSPYGGISWDNPQASASHTQQHILYKPMAMFEDTNELTVSQARRLVSAHRIEEALHLVHEITAREPDNLDAWLFLAFHYMDYDYRRALEAWQQIARLRPGDRSAQEAIETLSSYLA